MTKYSVIAHEIIEDNNNEELDNTIIAEVEHNIEEEEYDSSLLVSNMINLVINNIDDPDSCADI